MTHITSSIETAHLVAAVSVLTPDGEIAILSYTESPTRVAHGASPTGPVPTMMSFTSMVIPNSATGNRVNYGMMSYITHQQRHPPYCATAERTDSDDLVSAKKLYSLLLLNARHSTDCGRQRG